jgi:hypothetical protein
MPVPADAADGLQLLADTAAAMAAGAVAMDVDSVAAGSTGSTAQQPQAVAQPAEAHQAQAPQPAMPRFTPVRRFGRLPPGQVCGKRKLREDGPEPNQQAPEQPEQPQGKAPRTAWSLAERGAMVRAVSVQLSPEDHAKAEAGTPMLIDFTAYACIWLTAARCLVKQSDVFKGRVLRVLKQTLKKWFFRFFEASPHDRVSGAWAKDRPRRASGSNVSNNEWRELKRILLTARWTDRYGNQRRMPDVAFYRQRRVDAAEKDTTLSAEKRREAREEVAKLDDIRGRSGYKSWSSLTRAVARRFNLAPEREVFKRTRHKVLSKGFSRRMLGYEPMLEHYRANAKAKGAPQEHDKVKWQKTVDREGRPAPRAAAAAAAAGGTATTRIDHEYLHFDREAFALTASLDGFRVMDRNGADVIANQVWVEAGPDRREVLEVLESPDVGGNCTSTQAIYFFQIIMAAWGVVATVAMASGTKCVSSAGDMLYWFHQFDTYGIEVSPDVQKWLARKKWTVCSCDMPACLVHGLSGLQVLPSAGVRAAACRELVSQDRHCQLTLSSASAAADAMNGTTCPQ